MTREEQLLEIIENEQGTRREQAFAELFGMYKQVVYGWVKSQMNSSEDAKEIALDVLNKAYYWLKDGKRQYGNSIKPYLYRVTRNLVINYRRKKSIITYMNELDQTTPATPEVEENINQEFMKELLKDLSDKQRLTYELFVMGFSHKEIAERVPWQDDKSSKSQLAKIRKLIIKKFNSYKN